MASDNFNRADSSNLGSDWVETSDLGNLSILSNELRIEMTFHPFLAGVLGVHQAAQPDRSHFAQFEYRSGDPEIQIFVHVRPDSTHLAMRGYSFLNSGTGFLLEYNGGDIRSGSTSLKTFTPIPLVAGDIVRLEVDGTTVTVRKNGTLYDTATGTLPSWGSGDRVAVGINTNVAGDSKWDNFLSDSLIGSTYVKTSKTGIRIYN